MTQSFVKFSGTLKFTAQRRCIYCHASRYSEDQHRKLGDEHVIAEAIGGVFILPEAACNSCETTINRFETALFRGGLASVRRHCGFKGKKRSESYRQHTIPVFDCSVENQERRVDIDPDDYPGFLFFAVPQPPKLINPNWEPVVDLWSHWVNASSLQTSNPSRPSFVEKYGLTNFALISTDCLAHAKTAAKVAHATAIGLLGADCFSPILRDFILGGEDDRCFDYVGGTAAACMPDQAIHRISFRLVDQGQERFLVASVRLFACFNSPAFDVVVGRPISDGWSIQEAEIAQDPPAGFQMMIGPDQSYDPRTHGLIKGLPVVSASKVPLQQPKQWFRAQVNFQ